MSRIPGTYDPVRRALEHLLSRMTETREQGKTIDCNLLQDEAGMCFNLSPAESALLERLLAEVLKADSPEEPFRRTRSA